MTPLLDYSAMLDIAIAEARQSMAEGGIPIGAALFDRHGAVLGRGHNRRVQEDDPSVHGETDAFRKAGRQRSYRDTIMVTTLAPCWYCSGLVRQFNIGTVVVGESVNFRAGPSTVDAIISALPPATPLQYLNEDAPTENPNDGNRWMKFRIQNGAEGWVREIDTEQYQP